MITGHRHHIRQPHDHRSPPTPGRLGRGTATGTTATGSRTSSACAATAAALRHLAICAGDNVAAAQPAVEAGASIVPESFATALGATDLYRSGAWRDPGCARSALRLVVAAPRQNGAALLADHAGESLREPRKFVRPRQLDVKSLRTATAVDGVDRQWDGRCADPVGGPHDLLLRRRLLDENKNTLKP